MFCLFCGMDIWMSSTEGKNKEFDCGRLERILPSSHRSRGQPNASMPHRYEEDLPQTWSQALAPQKGI